MEQDKRQTLSDGVRTDHADQPSAAERLGAAALKATHLCARAKPLDIDLNGLLRIENPYQRQASTVTSANVDPRVPATVPFEP